MGGYVRAGEMDGGGEALERLGITDDGRRYRIPLHLIRRFARAADQLEDGLILGSEGLTER
jgi:hypothetical protein